MNDNKQTSSKLKKETLSSPRWIVSLDEKNNVKLFQGNDNCPVIVLEASIEDSSDQRLHILLDCLAERCKALQTLCDKCTRLLIK